MDLGNCGLDGYLPDELFDDYFIENLEGLSLGYYNEYDENGNGTETSNHGKNIKFNSNEIKK